MTNFKGPYEDFRDKRIKIIKNYYGDNWFENKKILEIGCGYAEIGYEFYKLGAIVTASDARVEHLIYVNEKFPYIKTITCDLDMGWNFDEYYDLIIHAGTLYHLKNYEQNLINCFKNCDNMFLETVVSDSDDCNFVEYVNENGYDQAYNDIGCRPSEKNIEKIIKENNFSFDRYFLKDLNSTTTGIFDWKIKNTKIGYINNEDQPFVWLRRAWFLKNNK